MAKPTSSTQQRRRTVGPTRLYARPFTLRTCRHCDAPTFAGASEGFDVTADPYALTQAGQLAALLEARTLYRVQIRGFEITLWPYRAVEISVGVAEPIIPTHKCASYPAGIDRAASRAILVSIIPPIKTDDENRCPF